MNSALRISSNLLQKLRDQKVVDAELFGWSLRILRKFNVNNSSEIATAALLWCHI